MKRAVAKRLRCCGRFAYWRVPLGPWACTKCDRRYWPGRGVPDIPRAHEARFWAAIAELIAKLDELDRLYPDLG